MPTGHKQARSRLIGRQKPTTRPGPQGPYGGVIPESKAPRENRAAPQVALKQTTKKLSEQHLLLRSRAIRQRHQAPVCRPKRGPAPPQRLQVGELSGQGPDTHVLNSPGPFAPENPAQKKRGNPRVVGGGRRWLPIQSRWQAQQRTTTNNRWLDVHRQRLVQGRCVEQCLKEKMPDVRDLTRKPSHIAPPRRALIYPNFHHIRRASKSKSSRRFGHKA